MVDIGVGDTFDPTDTLTFSGAGTLEIEAGAQANLALQSMDADDVIDFKGLNVTSAIWDGNNLFLNGTQVGLTISGGLPVGDTFAFKSDGSGGTDLKILPQLVSVTGSTPAPVTEGSAIAVNFTPHLSGGATVSAFVIAEIPVGAVLSDGLGHTFTADATHSQVDVFGWNLSTLTIVPANDTNFELSATVTATDSQGYSYSAGATESVSAQTALTPPSCRLRRIRYREPAAGRPELRSTCLRAPREAATATVRTMRSSPSSSAASRTARR